MVEWLFFAVQWGCLQFVIVVFPDHNHLLFFIPDFTSQCLEVFILTINPIEKQVLIRDLFPVENIEVSF